MAQNLIYQNNKFVYGLKRFVVDEEADVEKIRTAELTPGSTAFVNKTSDLYVFTDRNTWIKQAKSSSGGSSGGGSGGDTPTDPSEDNTYIWDGGSID